MGMTEESNKDQQRPEPKPKGPGPKSGTGTEAERKGGVEPAKRQAERDWQDSAKESGD
jgi:hypothetical protein